MIGGYVQSLSPGFQRQADMFQVWVYLFFPDSQCFGKCLGIQRFFFQQGCHLFAKCRHRMTI